MRVILVDDNRLMLEGLQNLLEANDIEVVGTASDGLASVELVRRLKPDVILMDIRMSGCDGLSATKRIRAEMPDAKIIILTTSNEDQDLFEAIKSGACGYLLKSMDSDELLAALDQACQGTPPFSPGLAVKLLDEFARLGNTNESISKENASETEEDAHLSVLKPRQIEVLRMLSDGLSYKEIGARLFLSPRTVKYHMQEILDRLHLENRAQALAFAGRIGLKTDKPVK